MSRDVAFGQTWFDQGREVAYAGLTFTRVMRIRIRGGISHEFCPMPGTNPFTLATEIVTRLFPNATSPLPKG